jgi:hypothetical protein
MIGKTYLERGKAVVVLVRWGKGGEVLTEFTHRCGAQSNLSLTTAIT